MATLKEIQNWELEMLKEITDVCDKNDITYYLAYGTFLGAVRHKGFIPWDDDIDLYMTLPELEKFKKACKTQLPDYLVYQDYKTDRTTPYIFVKIRNTRVLLDSKSPNSGIWIDIFPVIESANGDKKLRKQIYYICKYQYYLANQMNIKNKGQYTGFLSKTYRIIRELLFYRPLTKFYYKKMLELQDEKSGFCLSLGTRFFGEFNDEMFELNKRKRLNSSFFERISYPFEKYDFYGFEDYDKYLTTEYGEDYMTPKKFNQHIKNYEDVIKN